MTDPLSSVPTPTKRSEKVFLILLNVYPIRGKVPVTNGTLPVSAALTPLLFAVSGRQTGHPTVQRMLKVVAVVVSIGAPFSVEVPSAVEQPTGAPQVLFTPSIRVFPNRITTAKAMLRLSRLPLLTTSA